MVEDDIKPLLGQIDGVAAVEVNGGQVRELQVNLDPRRLEALNLPLTEVSAKLAADNLDVPGGQVRRDGKAVSLRTQGQYKTAAEIENVILRSSGGSTVRVKDVSEVVDGFQDRTSTTRLNGEDAVSFSVRKQSGANTVEVQRKLDAALANQRSELVRKAVGELIDVGQPAGFENLLLGGLRPRKGHVLANRAVKQKRILEDTANVATQVGHAPLRHLQDVLARDVDAPRIGQLLTQDEAEK